jgi:hypothetical protein
VFQLTQLKTSVLSLAVAALLVPALPVPVEAQGAQRAQRAQRRPAVQRPAYRPVVRYYSYPYYWRNVWWASYGYPMGFYGYRYTTPYGYGYPYQYGYFPADVTTAVRLQVTPREAEVFVDGYSAGVVDDFDGVFQRLRLQPGGHEISVYLEGYRTFRQNIHLSPGATQTIRHQLEPLGPGEGMEAKPAPNEDRARPADLRQEPRDEPRRLDQSPERSPREEPRGRFGTLSVRVQPSDAEIIVDGQRWTAPADSSRIAIELPQGRHTIEIRKAGFSVFREEVLIRPGAATNLNVSLSP